MNIPNNKSAQNGWTNIHRSKYKIFYFLSHRLLWLSKLGGNTKLILLEHFYNNWNNNEYFVDFQEITSLFYIFENILVYVLFWSAMSMSSICK